MKPPGLGADVHTYEGDDDQARILAHRVTELVRQGFSHDDIAIVSCRGMAQAVFAERERFGSVPVRRFTGRYDDSGAQLYTDGRLACETIFRFKGQQAPAVILTDIDASLTDCERTRAVLYCGMTRATVRLELLVHSENELRPRLTEALA